MGKCPVCGGELVVRVLECGQCGTRIEGTFTRSPFERLNEEQVEFLLEFLKSEGNFSEVARKLGLSFPTVKMRLHSILKTLGVKPEGMKKPPTSEVIEMLERGEITVSEAEKLLKGR